MPDATGAHAPDHVAHDRVDGARPGVPWGLLLSLVGAVATLWLGASGQLDLYIHPRYNWFTLTMAALAVPAVLGAWAIRGRPHHPGRRWGSIAATLAVVLALLVVPPATLSASTAQQRSTNSSADGADAVRLAGGNPASFRLRDWSVLVTDPQSATTYAGQPVKLIGFVTRVSEDSSGVFYLSRFVVTCCTVDAQPVGVPVLLENWATEHRVDQWLEVTGRLVPAADAPNGTVLAIQPSAIRGVDQPDQPYEY